MPHDSELLSAAARLAAIAATSPRRPRIPGLDKIKTTGHIKRMPRVSVREEIVESALVEFHRRGFSACSVEDITRAAGVPKGSFYNHFKSKEELGAEVVRRYSAA